MSNPTSRFIGRYRSKLTNVGSMLNDVVMGTNIVGGQFNTSVEGRLRERWLDASFDQAYEVTIMDRRAALVALAGAIPFARTALAQTGPIGPDQYRLMALMGGDFAIRTSQLALQKGQSAGVRQFAQLEINEQTAVAASLSATPGTLDQLRRLRAGELDQIAFGTELGS